MAVQFNIKQKETFDRLKDFVQDNELNTFILKGYAGTGKTLLVQEFARYLKSKQIKYKLMATTGRAAAVLRGKTGFETCTIHSALYSFDKVDGDHDHLNEDSAVDEYGQMRLIFTPNLQLSEECIYIVDEASMLASEQPDNETSFAIFGTGDLLPDLLRAVGNNKIIFVGDDCQLPPVYQNVSPALDEQWFINHGRFCTTAVLDQIMRTHEDNDILQLASQVRQAIGTESSSKWIHLPASNRNNCSVYNDENTVFLAYFNRFLQYGSEDSIAIAQSNKTCNHLNKYFRKKLFNNTLELLEVGEVLMVTQNNYLVPLTNGDFVKILELGEVSEKQRMRFQNVRVQHIVTKVEYEIKLALEPFSSGNPNLHLDQQRMLMIEFSRRMKARGIRPNTDEYKASLQKDAYLNSLRATYGYVVTCHKSQGGEWKEVFLFLNRSMYVMNPDTLRRWWYTAVTRTKDRLHLHKDWWIT